MQGYEFNELTKRARVIISLGGDGNFIVTCRRAAQSEAYIYGVHTGHLGFLTDSTLDEFGEFLDQFLNGIYLRQEGMTNFLLKEKVNQMI